MNKKNNFFLASELTKKEAEKKFAKYHILPIPLEKTVSYGKGTRKGPKAILKASNELERNSNEYEPCKQGIYTHPAINCDLPMKKVLDDIEKLSFKISKNNKIPIAIGGEHTLSYGVINGIKKAQGLNAAEIGIIQLDAHADLRKKYMNQKYSHACVMYLLASQKYKILQIGVRAISHKEILERSNFEMYFIDNTLLKKKNWSQISLPIKFPKNIYISFDVDILDPSIMPATGTPVPKGINYEEAIEIISKLTKNQNILGLDFVEFSPIKTIKAYDFISANLIYDLIGVIESNSNTRCL